MSNLKTIAAQISKVAEGIPVLPVELGEKGNKYKKQFNDLAILSDSITTNLLELSQARDAADQQSLVRGTVNQIAKLQRQLDSLLTKKYFDDK